MPEISVQDSALKHKEAGGDAAIAAVAIAWLGSNQVLFYLSLFEEKSLISY